MKKIGDPNCPQCKGHGFIYSASLLEGGSSCKCLDPFLKSQNVNKAWPGLLSEPVPENLKTLSATSTKKNLWITSSRETFRQYLKKLILTMPTHWECKVRTDAELLDSWFGTAKAQGTKIFDLEIDESTLKAIDIPDLVVPSHLCILWLGVKELPNKEAPHSLLEAFNYRAHLGKPTWIVDQPSRPFDATHMFYSDEMASIMSSWDHLALHEDRVTKVKSSKNIRKVNRQPNSSMAGAGETSTSNHIDRYLNRLTDLKDDKPKRSRWK